MQGEECLGECCCITALSLRPSPFCLWQPHTHLQILQQAKEKKKKVPETVMLLTSRIIWIHSEGEKCDTMMKDKSLMVLFLS